MSGWLILAGAVEVAIVLLATVADMGFAKAPGAVLLGGGTAALLLWRLGSGVLGAGRGVRQLSWWLSSRRGMIAEAHRITRVRVRELAKATDVACVMGNTSGV
jgi:hypothetical protein